MDKRVDFVARRNRSSIYLTGADATLVLGSPTAGTPQSDSVAVLSLQFVGRSRLTTFEALDPAAAKVNVFRGDDPRRWHSGVQTYSRIKYRQIYQGIDLVYYFGPDGQLEYDLVVAPGADLNNVRLRFGGAHSVEINEYGDLRLQTRNGSIQMRRPQIYQTSGDARHLIDGRYIVDRQRDVRFKVADYDRDRPLVIDPVFEYSTYLGGTGTDQAKAIAVDSDGNSYVTGYTESLDFPTLAAARPILNGFRDAFVAKFDSTGVLQYSTYLGGRVSDEGHAIAVDVHGSAYVTGFTFTSSLSPSDFPTTAGAFQTIGHGDDAFVTKLDRYGALVASTLLGGSGREDGLGIAVDSAGHPYVTGLTQSLDFPTAIPLQPGSRGSTEAFVTKLNTGFTGLEYSTFLGGNRVDEGHAVAVDQLGNAAVVGVTSSTNFPVANAFQAALAGASDAFVAKINAAGSAFVFSTYFGGSVPTFVGGDESGTGAAIDAAGHIVVGGDTNSVDFPVMGAFQPYIGGTPNPVNGGFEDDGFLAKFSSSGALLFSSFLGGNGTDAVLGVAADAAGNMFAAGRTRSSNFPLAGDQPAPIGDIGAYQSIDGGLSWTPLKNGLGPSLTAIVVDPALPSTLYAGTANDGVFKSTDYGATWRSSSSGITSLYITELVVDPMAPSTLYAATAGNGVFKSIDFGANWVAVNTGLNVRSMISLAIDPTNPATLYAGTLIRGVEILYKTTNGGVTWSPKLGYQINAIAVDPSASAIVYAASGVTLFKTVDGGTTWSTIFTEPSHLYHFTALAIDPSHASTVYAGTDGRGVYKTTDGGLTWQNSSAGLTFTAVNSLALDPGDPQVVYVGTAGGGVFKSSNGAVTWSPLNAGVNTVVVTDVAIDPQSRSTLYIAADGLQGDGFSTAIDAAGSLVYSTYLGGRSFELATGVGVAPTGDINVTGWTRSLDWPITTGATQPAFGRGFSDAFVSSLTCPLPLTILNSSVSSETLWPPNHQMLRVSIDYTTSGCGSIQCNLGVASNEPVNGTGDGDGEPDWQVVDARNVLLRAERSALGSGRIYTVTTECSDARGHHASQSQQVVVPLNLK